MKTVAKKVPGLVLLAVALFGLYLAGAWKADRASWPSLVPAMALGLPPPVRERNAGALGRVYPHVMDADHASWLMLTAHFLIECLAGAAMRLQGVFDAHKEALAALFLLLGGAYSCWARQAQRFIFMLFGAGNGLGFGGAAVGDAFCPSAFTALISMGICILLPAHGLDKSARMS